MLSFLLFLAVGVGMGALAAIHLVRKKGLKNASFVDQGEGRVYRSSIDTQAVRSAYASTRPY